MDVIHRYPVLMPLLGILLLAKFAVVPILSWQQEYAERIVYQQKRVAKGEAAIANQAQTASLLKKLQNDVSSLQAQFYPSGDNAALKLKIQKTVEQLASEHNITMSNFGWGYSGEVPDTNISRHVMSFQFSGKTYDLLQFHLALESGEKIIDLSRFTYMVQKQTSGRLGTARGTIEAMVFQLSGEASEQGNQGVSNNG
ncbi:hypothetical protein OE749_01090 [Aestuariibacter sp. AA17]|uniref:General secretion pathway, M protein n=1 Tax=Fluctibacter corallii TaxID=2984329 RepID=A0ABT3A3P4_9ALTE|nr:hypothetical protein [Aestuariibacter sp. AA17]MCV2883289.1 hypothetical protein [Aestuariibacter sp. AA17]